MSKQITRDILIKSQSGGETVPGKMDIVEFTEKEKKARAIKSLLTFWGIGAVCVLIPIAHFILVPGFLIGGAIVAKRKWETDREGLDATCTCPDCGEEVSISLEKNPELPQWLNCPNCLRPLELQPAATDE